MEPPSFRQRLALRLEGYPLLRTLVLDTAFFWAFALSTATAFGIALAVPKIWRTSPDSFSRATIKVSLIDLAQAWSLARAARKAEAAGNYDQAMQAWRGAVANNLADPGLHRGLLRYLRSAPVAPGENVMIGLFSSAWLLALAHTNAQDARLAAAVLEKYHLPEIALEILKGAPAAPDLKQSPEFACSLLSAGRADAFQERWTDRESEWKQDPRMQLYHDAAVAGWEGGTAGIEAFLRLRQALRSPDDLGLTAARLLLLAGSRRGTPEDTQLALVRLQEARAASVRDYAVHWHFLASLGRFAEAKALALDFVNQFGRGLRLPSDAAEYARTLAAFGLRAEAVSYLQENLGRFVANPAVWETYLSILIDARRWSEVRQAAAEVRTRTASFETARVLGIYAEYRAEVAEDRQGIADRVAGELVRTRILDGALALRIAADLIRDHRADRALELLQAKRQDLSDSVPYWQVVFQAGMSLRDVPALTESSEEMLRLSPNDPVALSNRAAMLIVLQEHPTEALEITFRLLSSYPGVAAFQVNHAFSLLLNNRAEDAWNLLQKVNLLRLDRQAESAYYLALAEAQNARGAYPEALAAAERVQPGLILPPQVARLTALRRELRARVGS